MERPHITIHERDDGFAATVSEPRLVGRGPTIETALHDLRTRFLRLDLPFSFRRIEFRRIDQAARTWRDWGAEASGAPDSDSLMAVADA